jgi:hypothetical protein
MTETKEWKSTGAENGIVKGDGFYTPPIPRKAGTYAQTVRKDAVTGRIVSSEYVGTHPRTTETEHRPKRTPKK